VHDSGLERAHVADVAESEGIAFAEIGTPTKARLTDLLDPGLVPANPLDVWGTGASTRELFAGSLLALAADPAVQAVALAVDLVHELDGDDAYLQAVLDANEHADTPVAVLTNLPSVIDQHWAGQLRAGGVPVLEGTRSGLRALAHLLEHARVMGADLVSPRRHQIGSHDDGLAVDTARQARGRARLEAGGTSGAQLLELLAEYGISVARTLAAEDLAGTLAAADDVGYPVVLKTGQPEIAHKSDVGGVVLGIRDAAGLAGAYAELSARLGPRALVSHAQPAGVELAVGVVTDPALGPLVVVGAGGVLVELLADRAVALPPVSGELAADLLAGLRVSKLLAGVRGAPPVSTDAVAAAIRGVSALALELGDQIEALDINPLICRPDGAIAVDALVIRKRDSAGS
jgi:acyl-CoA synthetase (NDP forming)